MFRTIVSLAFVCATAALAQDVGFGGEPPPLPPAEQPAPPVSPEVLNELQGLRQEQAAANQRLESIAQSNAAVEEHAAAARARTAQMDAARARYGTQVQEGLNELINAEQLLLLGSFDADTFLARARDAFAQAQAEAAVFGGAVEAETAAQAVDYAQLAAAELGHRNFLYAIQWTQLARFAVRL
jgi:hypothetical protein